MEKNTKTKKAKTLKASSKPEPNTEPNPPAQKNARPTIEDAPKVGEEAAP